MAKSRKPNERKRAIVLKPAPDEIFAYCDLVKDRQAKGLRLLDESHSRQRQLSKEYRLLDDEYWEITRKIDDEFYAGNRKWGHEDELSRRLDTICDRQEAIKVARKNYWNRDFYIHDIISEYTNRLFKSLDGPRAKNEGNETL